jgi:integrase
MTKIAFSDTKLRSLPAPSKGQTVFWDDKLPTFGLRVSQGGSKTFVLGREKTLITIGKFGILSLADARGEAKRLLAEFTLGKVRPQSITFSQALDVFLEEKTKSRRPHTVETLRQRLTQHFTFKGQLADVTHQEVVRKLGKIPTNSERDHALAVAKTFFTWAHNRRYIDDNPTRGISPYGHISRTRVLSDEEIKCIYTAACEMGTFGAIVRLLILSGQRRGEAAALQFSWIQNDTITFPKEITKNGREHRFPIGKTAISAFPTTATNSALLFPAKGQPTKPFNGWSKSKSALDRRSGIKDWTLHDIRRTFATRLAEMGIQPHVIERLLNHASGQISGVSAIYNRASYLSEMREAVEKWEGRLAKLLASP